MIIKVFIIQYIYTTLHYTTLRYTTLRYTTLTMTTPQKINIYGFSGKLGCGKNYLAEKIFKPTPPFLLLAFADPLKIELCVRENIPYESVFHTKDHQSRIALQKYGTEMREKYGPYIWINYMHNLIKMHSERGIYTFIITDVRYPNELMWIKSLGGVIVRIEAPQRNLDELKKEANGDPAKMQEISSHSSEIALDNYQTQFDYIINNDYGVEVTLNHIEKI